MMEIFNAIKGRIAILLSWDKCNARTGWLDVCLSVALEKFPDIDTRETGGDQNVVVTSD